MIFFTVDYSVDPALFNHEQLRHLPVAMRQDAPVMDWGANREILVVDDVRELVGFPVKAESGNGVLRTHV